MRRYNINDFIPGVTRDKDIEVLKPIYRRGYKIKMSVVPKYVNLLLYGQTTVDGVTKTDEINNFLMTVFFLRCEVVSKDAKDDTVDDIKKQLAKEMDGNIVRNEHTFQEFMISPNKKDAINAYDLLASRDVTFEHFMDVLTDAEDPNVPERKLYPNYDAFDAKMIAPFKLRFKFKFHQYVRTENIELLSEVVPYEVKKAK